ncbi:MAG TPA: protein-glutamate O-methyltransferase CheR [Bryobacteraceae bacterium]|nr:protein-glutamate O-methyltransferase CheR [Bryobacteraceae bacterium]
MRGVERAPADPIRPLASHEFRQICDLAYRTFGLELKHGKEELVSARLRRLVKSGGFRSFQEYYQHVIEDRSGQALAGMIDALTTNHTAFLREPDHFDLLRQQVVPLLAGRKTVDVWCAACATGEELWTLAFLLNESLPGHAIHLFASDISTRALETARRAVYPAGRRVELPGRWVTRFLSPEGQPVSHYRVNEEIRRQADFRRINLVEPFRWPKPFPVIFCRNVMIYFDRATQAQVVNRLVENLEPGGYLFVGHAESLAGMGHGLEYVCPAVYRKPPVKKGGRWPKS